MVQRTVSQACDLAAALAVLDELEAEVARDEAGADGDGLELEDDEVVKRMEILMGQTKEKQA